MAWRRIAPYLALGLVALLIGALLLIDGPEAGAGTFPIRIDGPDGPIWNGSVDADPASPYTVLLAAADRGGFSVDATEYPNGVFVEAIDGHRWKGAGGWCYAVWFEGAWSHPVMSADAWGLQDGDAVWWHYEVDGCPD